MISVDIPAEEEKQVQIHRRFRVNPAEMGHPV